jgi:hypothetical protein
MSQVVEHLPGKCDDTLSSNPSTDQKKYCVEISKQNGILFSLTKERNKKC